MVKANNQNLEPGDGKSELTSAELDAAAGGTVPVTHRNDPQITQATDRKSRPADLNKNVVQSMRG